MTIDGKLDEIEYDRCNGQGEIFEYFVTQRKCDLKDFTRKFMTSDFCAEEIDPDTPQYYPCSLFTCGAKIQDLIENGCKKNENMNNADLAWWVGFIYRQLNVETGLKSSELYEKVPVRDLIIMYPGLHTIEENHQTDSICEDYGLHKIKRFIWDGKTQQLIDPYEERGI